MVAPLNLNSNAVGGRHRGGRGNDPIVGRVIKIRRGPLKGYRGRVKEVTGSLVRVELDSQMKIVTGKTSLFGIIGFSFVFLYLLRSGVLQLREMKFPT